MKIEVRRITDPDLWREFAEMTTGKPCKMSWYEMLKTGHSPIREQRYLIKFYDIPQFVTGHIIRHDKFANVGVRSKRIERGGENFREVCNGIADTMYEQTDEVVRMGHLPMAVAELFKCVEKVRELPDRFDREAPSSFAFDTNAEEIINISRARLCSKASKETREIWQNVLDLLEEVDPDLVKFCKRPCCWNGFCRERKPCGYMATDAFIAERRFFVEQFKPKH